jgi:hypothetical protein
MAQECVRRERLKTCDYCPVGVMTKGPTLCSRGLRPGHLPWPHWRDEDPGKVTPEEVKVATVMPGNFVALADKVQQLTGLTQHLRNEVAALKGKGKTGTETGVIPL